MSMPNAEGKGLNRMSFNTFRSLLCRLQAYGSWIHVVY